MSPSASAFGRPASSSFGPLLEIRDGYWQRAGELRARVLARGAKARLADTLVAQSCLDQDAALITLDDDFRAFVLDARLRLLP